MRVPDAADQGRHDRSLFREQQLPADDKRRRAKNRGKALLARQRRAASAWPNQHRALEENGCQMDSRFTNQVVVVTGAASGIGVVIAKHFADAGARLVLSDVDEKRLNSVAEDIASSGRDKPNVRAGDLSMECV